MDPESEWGLSGLMHGDTHRNTHAHTQEQCTIHMPSKRAITVTLGRFAERYTPTEGNDAEAVFRMERERDVVDATRLFVELRALATRSNSTRLAKQLKA